MFMGNPVTVDAFCHFMVYLFQTTVLLGPKQAHHIFPFRFSFFFKNKHICISFCNKLKSTRINVLSMSWLNVSQYLLAFIYFPWLPPVTSLTASHKCVFHHHKPTRYLVAVNSIVLPECIKCQHLLSVNLSYSNVNK